MRRKIFLWLFIVAISISMIGCGSAKSSETAAMADSVAPGMAYSGGAPSGNGGNDVKVTYSSSVENGNSSTVLTSQKNNESEQQKGADSGSTVSNLNAGQKIIFTGQIEFETLDFEKTTSELSQYIISVGGYQQSSSINGGRIGYTGLRSAQYVFRIPKTKYNQAFVDMKKFGTVVFEQSSGEDKTDRYFDTEARLKSLQVQHERLLALLQKADKMEDILKIEKELQTTLYEIENYTGTLKKWDSLVEYSTLSVNVREVAEIKPEVKESDGLFKRIVVGFKNSISGVWEFIQNSLVFIAAALPVILPVGVIGYVIYRIIRKRMKKAKVKKTVVMSKEDSSQEPGDSKQ